MKRPQEILEKKAAEWKCDVYSQKFAELMDDEDPLKEFRQRFHYPKKKNYRAVDISLLNDQEALYFAGNSLGLQPKNVRSDVEKVLENWEKVGVSSHFQGYLPAASSDLYPKESMAKLVGAKTEEIAIMNGLTVNLHLLLATFYRPTPSRKKILIESKIFPSDMFVVSSQISLRSYEVEDSLLILKPREGEYILRPEDIISTIEKEGNSICLILLPGVQYFTGQLYDMKTITEIGHKMGCIVGFDLAHAICNVELHLHEWNVDFAAWCTYKYLNTGPGGIAGIFVNEKYTQYIKKDFPQLKGWWGVDPEKKFLMNEEKFEHCIGADMFKLSNPSPVLISMLMTSLDIIEEATLKQILKKQFLLTGYYETLINYFICKNDKSAIQIITPSDPRQRGSQLTLKINSVNTNINTEFEKRGIICDTRKDCFRISPVPLYNTYMEGYKFVKILQVLLEK